jgi:RimJ/RimL family protein N-acetyltransferase
MIVGLRFAFHELNLFRVCLTVFSYNAAAIALYEQLGFTREGTYREHIERDGQRYDMVLYGLLRPEWEKMQGSGGAGVRGG